MALNAEAEAEAEAEVFCVRCLGSDYCTQLFDHLVDHLHELLPEYYALYPERRNHVLRSFVEVLEAIGLDPDSEEQQRSRFYANQTAHAAKVHEVEAYKSEAEKDQFDEWEGDQDFNPHYGSNRELESILSSMQLNDVASGLDTRNDEELNAPILKSESPEPLIYGPRNQVILDDHHWNTYIDWQEDEARKVENIRPPTPHPFPGTEMPVGRRFCVNQSGQAFITPRFN